MRHKILVTAGLILLWALAVIAVVSAEAFWLAAAADTGGSRDYFGSHRARAVEAVVEFALIAV